MNTRCIFFAEGDCEAQLLSALKLYPGWILPGKVRVFNVVQDLIPKSQLLTLQDGMTVVFLFDTDTEQTERLLQNIQRVRKYCRVRLLTVAQVLNLEDELVRCTDVREARELTQSKSPRNFKSDFCRMRPEDCLAMLSRHHLELQKLWVKEPPAAYEFIRQDGKAVKQKQ
ncbi:MAG: hypothetical protein IJJ23_06120 [Clostridia bacterium]|nr:hypothetical protein [Clostridia bacterium]